VVYYRGMTGLRPILTYLRPLLTGAALALAAAGLTGCQPGGDARLDEERDPHFQRGRDLVNSQEFKAAVDEFEKALESNPHSAPAHYELGWLYDNKINDYAAAIYHYERHLALTPNSPRAQQVRDRIRGCKLELASTEFPLPNSQNLQHEVETLTEENRLLRLQLDAARFHPATAPVIATIAVPSPVQPALAPAPTPPLAAPVPPATITQAETPSHTFTVAVNSSASHPRVYVVQAKDTINSVASRYGLKPSLVLAANPNVNPTRLRIGQSLNLP